MCLSTDLTRAWFSSSLRATCADRAMPFYTDSGILVFGMTGKLQQIHLASAGGVAAVAPLGLAGGEAGGPASAFAPGSGLPPFQRC